MNRTAIFLLFYEGNSWGNEPCYFSSITECGEETWGQMTSSRPAQYRKKNFKLFVNIFQAIFFQQETMAYNIRQMDTNQFLPLLDFSPNREPCTITFFLSFVIFWHTIISLVRVNFALGFCCTTMIINLHFIYSSAKFAGKFLCRLSFFGQNKICGEDWIISLYQILFCSINWKKLTFAGKL